MADILGYLAQQEAAELDRLRERPPAGSGALADAESGLRQRYLLAREPFINALADIASKLPPPPILISREAFEVFRADGLTITLKL